MYGCTARGQTKSPEKLEAFFRIPEGELCGRSVGNIWCGELHRTPDVPATGQGCCWIRSALVRAVASVAWFLARTAIAMPTFRSASDGTVFNYLPAAGNVCNGYSLWDG